MLIRISFVSYNAIFNSQFDKKKKIAHVRKLFEWLSRVIDALSNQEIKAYSRHIELFFLCHFYHNELTKRIMQKHVNYTYMYKTSDARCIYGEDSSLWKQAEAQDYTEWWKDRKLKYLKQAWRIIQHGYQMI